MSIVGYYDIDDEDLVEGGCYVDDRNPGPVTYEEALEIDRKALADGVVHAIEYIENEVVTMEFV